MARDIPRPFLIAKVDEGVWHLTVRHTRYNSQNYPITDSTLVESTFKTAAAARAYAREHHGAEAGQYASK